MTIIAAMLWDALQLAIVLLALLWVLAAVVLLGVLAWLWFGNELEGRC